MAVCERSKQRAKHTLTRNCCAVIAVMIVFGTAGCGAQKPAVSLPGKPEPAAVTTPAPKAMPRPTEAPKETETPSVVEAFIRPEVKEALDSYEAYMDEYIDFMERYKAADAADMVAMMGDYTDMLLLYSEFAEKIDALGESELTNAELAYYLEVTNRVSQKLLSAAG